MMRMKKGDSVAETCWLNRESMTAEQIGAALGITRNAVIGHWYRIRHGLCDPKKPSMRGRYIRTAAHIEALKKGWTKRHATGAA